MKNFIQTQDEKVAETLRNEGYVELSKQGNFFVFINDITKPKTFDEQKITYTNILNV